MRICVLASGSEGNSTFIETDSHKILIDIGMNLRYLKNKLDELDVTLNEIDTVLISHTHSDHIGALDNFIKKYDSNIYMSKAMFDEISNDSLIKQYDNIKYFNDDFFIDNVKIELIKTSHDSADSGIYCK